MHLIIYYLKKMLLMSNDVTIVSLFAYDKITLKT